MKPPKRSPGKPAAATRLQAGAVEALGEARRTDAIPCFIEALGDDTCRPAAEAALHKLGAQARAALVEAAASPKPGALEESPSSVRRRRSALGLMARMLLPRQAWRSLRPCLDDRDAGIVLAAARLAVKLGNLDDKAAAVRRLAEVLPSADSSLQRQIEDCLHALLKKA